MLHILGSVNQRLYMSLNYVCNRLFYVYHEGIRRGNCRGQLGNSQYFISQVMLFKTPIKRRRSYRLLQNDRVMTAVNTQARIKEDQSL